MQTLPASISLRFRFWTFISMLMVVFVHAYNLNIRYLQPWTVPGEPLTPTSFTEYFISNGLFRFFIPMLFVISGYLYALHDNRPYSKRVKKRLRTLGLPYLLWSAAGFIFVYVLEMFPYTKSIVANSHIMQISDNRLLLHDYRWYEILVRWIIIPVPYQLWFVRVLLVYNIAYPALRWCVTNHIVKWIFFTGACLLWLATFGAIFIEGEGLLFFALGVWMQKNTFDIEKAPRVLNPYAWGIACIFLCAGKTWLAFKGHHLMGDRIFPVLAIMHKFTILSGLIAAWYGSGKMAVTCMRSRWFAWLSAFSFVIYAMHAPAVALVIDPSFAFLRYCYGYRIVSFICLPVIVVACCIILGVLLRRLSPKSYGVLTGGRGFS